VGVQTRNIVLTERDEGALLLPAKGGAEGAPRPAAGRAPAAGGDRPADMTSVVFFFHD